MILNNIIILCIKNCKYKITFNKIKLIRLSKKVIENMIVLNSIILKIIKKYF